MRGQRAWKKSSHPFSPLNKAHQVPFSRVRQRESADERQTMTRLRNIASLSHRSLIKQVLWNYQAPGRLTKSAVHADEMKTACFTLIPSRNKKSRD